MPPRAKKQLADSQSTISPASRNKRKGIDELKSTDVVINIDDDTQLYSHPRSIPSEYESLIPEMCKKKIRSGDMILNDPVRRYDEAQEKALIRTYISPSMRYYVG